MISSLSLRSQQVHISLSRELNLSPQAYGLAGKVMEGAQELDAALMSYRKAEKILARMCHADPDNVEVLMLNEMFICLSQITALCLKQGDLKLI